MTPTPTGGFPSLRAALLFVAPLVGASELNFDFPYGETEPVPFSASVDPAFIEETLLKASLYRPSIDLLDNEQSNAGLREGIPRENMTALASYWVDEYDWFKAQDEIFGNFSHYAVTIPGGGGDYEHDVALHFVHERSEDENAIPILILHGWPSTHLEWSKVIGPLSSSDGESGQQSFHVVAPDLPGFGFSPAPTYSGLGSSQLSVVLDKLMKKLGYEKYGVASTDLGWFVGLYMADVVAESLIGHYSDFWFIIPNATDIERFEGNQSTPEETRYLNSLLPWMDDHYSFGPVHHQSPLAIGQAMSDTPVGFAGWYWFAAQLLSDGWDYTFDEIITTTMTLFIQGTYGNMRLYREIFGNDLDSIPRGDVPAGAGLFGSPNAPLEILYNIHIPVRIALPLTPCTTVCFNADKMFDQPRSWMDRVANVVSVFEHEEGGHFPAHNVPDLWVDDVRQFFGGLVSDD